MKKLLLVTGDLATGKSTFAGMLSERYGAHVFYKDRFKELLGDTIGFRDRSENLKLSMASAVLMRMVLEEFCRMGTDLILESNFRQAELEAIRQIAKKHGYEVLTLVLRGSLEVLHQRFLHRLHHEGRHAVHACGGFEEFEGFRAYVSGQRQLQVPGEYVEVDADTFEYQRDLALLERLDRFWKGENEMMRIETDRSVITKFDSSMAEAVHLNSLDEDNRRFVPDEVFETVEEAAETIEFLMGCYESGEGPLVYPVLLKDGTCIGYVQAVPLEDGVWEIGYHIGGAYTKKGFATEAVKAFLPWICEKLGIRSMEGVCLADNLGSVKVLERCGFRKLFEGLGQYQGEERPICRYRWTRG